MSSFVNTLRECHSTVHVPMNNRALISGFEELSRTRRGLLLLGVSISLV
jgi:hypothetical protein